MYKIKNSQFGECEANSLTKKDYSRNLAMSYDGALSDNSLNLDLPNNHYYKALHCRYVRFPEVYHSITNCKL